MNNQMTATEWSQQYVQEWLREGETELWAGQAKTLRGKPGEKFYVIAPVVAMSLAFTCTR